MSKHLNYKERLAVQKLIEANGAHTEDGKYWKYNEGWNDERIAQELNVSFDSVTHCRAQTYGRVKRGPGANGFQKTRSRGTKAQLLEAMELLDIEVTNLKQRVRHLEEAYTNPASRKSNAGSTVPYTDPEKR